MPDDDDLLIDCPPYPPSPEPLLGMDLLFSLLWAAGIGLALTAGLLPYAFRLLGRLIGKSTRSKTQHRREILVQRALKEEAEQKEKLSEQDSKKKASSSTSLDSDWEKVNDGGDKTPTGNHTSSHIGASDESYDGVIGFFHYVSVSTRHFDISAFPEPFPYTLHGCVERKRSRGYAHRPPRSKSFLETIYILDHWPAVHN